MKKIGFVGYGELGKQIEKFFLDAYKHAEFFYFDDFIERNKSINVFSFQAYKLNQFEDLSFFVCLGYKHLDKKVKIIIEIIHSGRDLISFVHPTVYMDSTTIIGKNVVIYPGSIIDKDVIIHDGVLINNSVTVSHNCKINSGVYVSPGVVISGNVTIGKNSFIGSGSVISNNITIGHDCIIGVGSVVTKNLPDFSSVIGNPMRILNRPLRLN